MKIHLSEHNIMEADRVQLNDLPLAYLDTTDSKKVISVVKEPVFAGSYGESLLRAYAEFDAPDAYLFNEDGEILRNLTLKRLGNRYVYEPQNMVEFTPLSFAYSALVKKNMAFRNDAQYNLNVAVYEEGADLAFSKQLIAVFGDAPRRGVCPANISVNNQDMTPESLINGSFAGKDFIFIRSTDGVNVKQGGTTSALDMNALLGMNVNVWLSVDTFEGVLESRADNIYTLASPRLYSTSQYSIPSYKSHFNINNEHPSYPKSQYIYSSLFTDGCAALIMEKANGGYVIVTHKSFFDNLHENVRVLYEIMMQIFLKSYYRSKQYMSWITDQPVDYVAYKNSKYNLRHAAINLNEMLTNTNYDIGNEYTLLEVKTSNPNVVFTNMSPKKDLFFFKVNVQPDPPKNEGDISLYTSRHSVIHYHQEVIKKIESGLSVSTEVSEAGMYITVHPCKSSKHRICTLHDQRFRLEDPRIPYVLCCKPGTPDVENVFELIPSDEYSIFNGFKLATIKVITTEAAKVHDIRIEGGGLPLDSEPDYNMIDIGHVNGRPYRIGSTMIIRLPAKLKEHKDKIMSAIEKHASSGDYPVIVFE